MRLLSKANMILLVTLIASSTPVLGEETRFESTGDVAVTVEDADASIIKNRANIVTLNIVTSTASIKKLKQSYSVNLFFSRDFEAKPGQYPIEFSYLNKKDTLGGSFVSRAGMFSHDTQGEAEFLEFGDQITVKFSFRTFDKSEGSADRRMVTVTGFATCTASDLF